MAQAPTAHDQELEELAAAARVSARRLRNASRDAARDLARFEEALASRGIKLVIEDKHPTAREGEGDT